MRAKGLEHEGVGRLEKAVPCYEESLILFAATDVAERLHRLKRELAEGSAPVAPPSSSLLEAQALSLSEARALREEGKDAVARHALGDAVGLFKQSLDLFRDEELSRFVTELQGELELERSLDDLERMFDGTPGKSGINGGVEQ